MKNFINNFSTKLREGPPQKSQNLLLFLQKVDPASEKGSSGTQALDKPTDADHVTTPLNAHVLHN